MKIGKFRLVAAGALTMVALVAGAVPAYAGQDIPPTYSSDSGQGAGGKFVSSGDVVHACDLKLDGMRARVELWRSGIGRPGFVEDTQTDGKCVTKTVDVPEGAEVFLRVCRFRASDSTLHNCRNSRPGIA